MTFDADTLTVTEGHSEDIAVAMSCPGQDWQLWPAESVAGSEDVTASVGIYSDSVTVAAAHDVDNTDDTATYTITVTCSKSGETDETATASVEITVADDEPPSPGQARFDSHQLTLDEDSSDSVGYAFTEPDGGGWACAAAAAVVGDSDITATVDVADSEVDISAADDADYTDDYAAVTVAVTCTKAGHEDVVATASVQIAVADDERPPPGQVVFDSYEIVVSEGSAAPVGYTITDSYGLGWECTVAGTVRGDSDITATVSTLYSQVVVSAAHDAGWVDDTAEYTLTVTCTRPGFGEDVFRALLAVTVDDDEEPPGEVSFDADTLTVAEGSSDSVGYTFTEPGGGGWSCSEAQTAALTGDGDVTAVLDTTASQVDISAAHDADYTDDTATYTITVTCTKPGFVDDVSTASLAVTVDDDEVPPSVSLDSDRHGEFGVAEGASGSIGYTVTATYTITVTCANADHEDIADSDSVLVIVADDEPDYRVAYSSHARGEDDEIYAIDADGANKVQLTDNSVDDTDPRWSPDGTKIAYVTDDGDREIAVMDADGSNQRRLTDNSVYDSFPRWSPDGTKILAYVTDDGDREIAVMDADGSDTQQLTSNDYPDTDPAWSPDGTKIAYTGIPSSGDLELFVVDADGTNRRQLTDNSFHSSKPAWSPDGTKIAFQYRLLWFTLVKVIDADANRAGYDDMTLVTIGEEFAWTPDSSRLVTAISGGIYVRTADASGPLRVLQPHIWSGYGSGAYGTDPAWSPVRLP